MFMNTFKFPNHSSLLRMMFTNTFNPPDWIATPGVFISLKCQQVAGADPGFCARGVQNFRAR